MGVRADRGAGAPRSARFGARLALCTAAGLLVRLAAAVVFDAHRPLTGDAVWYWGVGRLLARGEGFVDPLISLAAGRPIPTAAHPPLYAVVLAIPPLLGAAGTLPARLWSATLGAVTVAVVGLLGREIADPDADRARAERTGLVAAALAAVFVDLWIQDVILMAEGLYALLVVTLVLTAQRQLRQPRPWHAVGMGLLAGAAAMTRAEALLLLGLLVGPALVLASHRPWRMRLRAALVAGVAAAAVIAPWAAYNHGRFAHPVVLTTTAGPLLAWTNCDAAWYGPDTGGWAGFCVPYDTRRDPTIVDREMREIGVRYAYDHATRLPAVLGLRLLRMLGLWQPLRLAVADLQLQDGGRPLAVVAILQYLLYALLAVAGAVLVHRRGVSLLPLGAVLATTTILALGAYGTLRFRIALDAVLPAPAAVALTAAVRRRAPAVVASCERAGGPAP